jgi:hypothetical protein
MVSSSCLVRNIVAVIRPRFAAIAMLPRQSRRPKCPFVIGQQYIVDAGVSNSKPRRYLSRNIRDRTERVFRGLLGSAPKFRAY